MLEHRLPLLRWLVSGVVTATVLWTAAAAILTIAFDGVASFADSLPYAPSAAVAGFIWSVLACGLYGPALALWPRVANRWPAIESSWQGLLAATGVLALPPTIIVPHLAATFPFGSPDYFREFLPWLIAVGIMSWGGLFLPRVLVPSLRRGAFSERRSLTSA